MEASSSSSMIMEDIGDFYEELSRHGSWSGAENSKSPLDKYVAEDIKVGKPDFKFEMAWDILVVPISSVASECAFSIGGGGDILD